MGVDAAAASCDRVTVAVHCVPRVVVVERATLQCRTTERHVDVHTSVHCCNSTATRVQCQSDILTPPEFKQEIEELR